MTCAANDTSVDCRNSTKKGLQTVQHLYNNRLQENRNGTTQSYHRPYDFFLWDTFFTLQIPDQFASSSMLSTFCFDLSTIDHTGILVDEQ